MRVAYTEWGPRHAERTVVCLHGLTRNSRDFDYLARYLAVAGIRVVAPDLPGQGRSDPLTRSRHYATPVYLAAMSGILARVGTSEVDWVGTSLGGHIGMDLAALPYTPIHTLVLNDFRAKVPGAALTRIRNYLYSDRRFRSTEELELQFRNAYKPFGSLTDEQWRHLAVHSAVSVGDGQYRQNYDPAIKMQFMLPIMIDVTLWNVWDRIECPVLIVRAGHSDLLRRDTVERMLHRGIAASRELVESIEFPDCGHALSLMEERQWRVLGEFLSRDAVDAAAPSD